MSAKANVITGLQDIYELKSCRKIIFSHKL